ncbi:putative peroxidase [Lupinus albus]|uniref:peroxidase n=1 Tax=Lupinus albus TaxID=3870 RepID=A0A6A4PJY5_LUPAL|nr:putative peroxidase [Lupinus albus]
MGKHLSNFSTIFHFIKMSLTILLHAQLLRPLLDPTIAPGLLRLHFHDCFVQRLSCADILALAARDAVHLVLTGRRDGRTSQSSQASNMPSPLDSNYGGKIRGLLGLRFDFEFPKAMIKLSNAEGEIRKVCSKFN